jgi:hypothetical protein
MKARNFATGVAAIAMIAAAAGCATWNEMDRPEKGTAVGATGGALAGAAIGGPIGAVVGAGAGAYVGHHQADTVGSRGSPNARDDVRAGASIDERGDPVVRSAQQTLNDRGFDAGVADGRMGPNTHDAILRFQRERNLPETGALDAPTLRALGLDR